jgi:hypothetical protein
MKKIMLALFLVSLAPTLVNASAMSEEKSRCYGKEIDAQSYRAWKADFHKFLSNYENLDPDARFTVSRGGLRKIIKLVSDFSGETSIKTPNALISDAQRLLRDLDNGDITPASATKIMKSGLIKFEDAMDDMVYRAQVRYPNCEIIPSQSSSSNAQRVTGLK